MSPKENIVKCRYSHCKHDTKEIPKDEAYKNGNAYYHKDCYQEKYYIEEIKKLYTDKVDPHPVYGFLNKVINTIVYENKVSAKQFYYCFIYALESGWKIHNPAGLYYVVKNEQLIKKYKTMMNAKIQREASNYDTTIEDSQPIRRIKSGNEKTLSNFMD